MNARSVISFFLALAWISPGFAQEDQWADHYARTITEAELQAHLEVLASDSFQGRDTGKEGQKLAAAYLRREFEGMGIPPVPAPYSSSVVEGYFQQYELVEDRSGTLTVERGQAVFSLFNGLLYFSEPFEGERRINEVVWLKDGSLIPESVDIRDRCVLIDGGSWGEGPEAMMTMRSRIEAARDRGAAVIMITIPSMATYAGMVHSGGTRLRLAYEAKEQRSSSAQTLLIDSTTERAWFDQVRPKKLRRMKVGRTITTDLVLRNDKRSEKVLAENVLAFIEGGAKKDEVVVITAHYDHIGVENGVVYNGADDDGSGTVALLEIADALSRAKAEGHIPLRSVLVMPVSGEEKGLLGSKYYSDHPVFPLMNTVADVNIDMIGRVDSSHAGKQPYVYVIGSDRLSSGLHQANERANATVGLQLDYTFNEANDPNRFYYRSDHYNFAKKNIPSVFYFSGVHEDYHQPGDDVEKIRFDLLRQRAQLAFHTVWILANTPERIVVDVNGKGN